MSLDLADWEAASKVNREVMPEGITQISVLLLGTVQYVIALSQHGRENNTESHLQSAGAASEIITVNP